MYVRYNFDLNAFFLNMINFYVYFFKLLSWRIMSLIVKKDEALLTIKQVQSISLSHIRS